MHRRKTSKEAMQTTITEDPPALPQSSSVRLSPVIITPPDHSPASVSNESFGRPNGNGVHAHHRHESTPLPLNKASLLGSPMLERTPPRSPKLTATLRTSGLASPLSPSHVRGPSSPRTSNFGTAPRMRVSATYPEMPLSASPYRSGFSLNGIPEAGDGAPNGTTNGYALRHSRSQSGMTGTSSSLASSPWQPYESPLSNYSPMSSRPRSPRNNSVPSSPLLPVNEDGSTNGFPNGTTTSNYSTPPDSSHRHSRIHSRNLSIFFPRPGNGSPNGSDAIAEDDDGQEIEYDDHENNGNGNGAPDVLIPTSSSSGDASIRGTIANGFKFGVKDPNGTTPSSPRLSKPKRRGHHHKHSLSHNFFSFMDPTSSIIAPQNQTPQQSASGLYITTPLNRSPVQNGDASRILPTPSTTHFPTSKTQHHFVDPTPGSSVSAITAKTTTKGATVAAGVVGQAKLFAAMQFVLGAWMWVEGQRQGTLACTGLGYWIVFDAAGLWLGAWGEQLRRRPRTMRQPYGSRRVETVALFAQSIYLIFASVYVCKEAFERVLLSSTEGIPGSGDSHEHHHQRIDDFDGPLYPITLLLTSTFSLLFSSFFYNNHSRLVEATGSHLPSSVSFIQSLLKPSSSAPAWTRVPPSWAILRLLSNPFSITPLTFSTCIWAFSVFLPPSQHNMADIAVACAETVLTFMIGYPAAVALGK
ncbi:hypothetical protein FRB95_011071, partial [Tulasnella sp. JGI-2019a]